MEEGREGRGEGGGGRRRQGLWDRVMEKKGVMKERGRKRRGSVVILVNCCKEAVLGKNMFLNTSVGVIGMRRNEELRLKVSVRS